MVFTSWECELKMICVFDLQKRVTQFVLMCMYQPSHTTVPLFIISWQTKIQRKGSVNYSPVVNNYWLSISRTNCHLPAIKVFRSYYQRPYFLPPMVESATENFVAFSSGLPEHTDEYTEDRKFLVSSFTA